MMKLIEISPKLSGSVWKKCSSLICHLPLQVCSVHGLIANGALGPALITKRQIVQHTRPAEDVAAPGDSGCHRGVEADGTRWHLMAVDALQKYTNGL